MNVLANALKKAGLVSQEQAQEVEKEAAEAERKRAEQSILQATAPKMPRREREDEAKEG